MTDHLEEYILAHIDSEPELLRELNRDAHVNLLHPRMISGHLQGRLLKMITQMINPHRVLEIGTYTGYSAMCIAEGLQETGELHTIEIDDEMEGFINKYLNRFEYRDKIKLYFDDALNIIPKFEDESFDFVFIDADKRSYSEYFSLVFNKVRIGGFILADNTLWAGKVVQDVESNDWQTKGIIQFNELLQKDNRIEKVIIPIRDGLTLIRKNKN